MIIGVDFSLTSTGVCAITDGEAECITVKSSAEDSWFMFPDRIHRIAQSIAEWADEYPSQFVIETPAFTAKSAHLDKMFGGWWMIIDQLVNEYGFAYPLRVTPQQVKKYATGKGTSHKDEVLAAVIRRYPDVLVSGNDQADALVLAAIGAGVEREPFETVTKYQQEVIDAVRQRSLEKK